MSVSAESEVKRQDSVFGALSVSVCMATYNGELYLREQLDSILLELREGDELVVVDDCSKDTTCEILLSYMGRDKRVKVFFNQRNLGVIKSFESALSKAGNEIIFLSDQDDVWLSGRVSSSLAIFASYEQVSTVVVNAEVLAFTDRTGTSFYPQGYTPSFSLFSQLYKNEFIGCCMGVRRRVLRLALPFAHRISMHDWWLGCCALMNGEVHFLNENKIYYRRHSSNASPSKRRKLAAVLRSRILDMFCFLSLLLRWVKRRGGK
ncbi:glycosyltransferase [Pseudomonas veronii]|uniref:glycosyltransferase n=1 Tax=Pseudomonas TaxID=286 RepID=UPI0009A53BEC|nr:MULTISPECIES: glycosyltransferase [Pseudomonas]MDY7551985.1 glycosyltransferase [Pseudomonas sp. FG1]MEB0050607.1 glycosyltransferase [Pseudomonas sp. FG1]RTY65690.1 glycosyltransferase [Pseudomonas veronii]